MAVDSADTVPDGVDEDCDGKVDENVDATRARCPKGMRVIEGTRGNDTLRGTPGRDCILGYGGNDTIYGDAGDDLIFGGPGDDKIFTGRGNAIVHGGPGNDTIDTSGSLISTVYGEAGNDNLIGGKGLDSLFGGEDNDKLNGGGGTDLLSGGGCHDWIVGGASCDLATGGADFDACDAEVSTDCERNARTRRPCTTDADCAASDRCAVFTNFCVPRSAKACGADGGPPACTPTAATDESCNGVDDDCNGTVDEDYVPQTTMCGSGSCHSMGTTACVNGTVVDSCAPGSPMGMDAVCNGIDDDCDGRTDEGFVSSGTTCGVGVCASTGSLSCVNGMVVDSCQAGTPEAATDTVCDGIDEDCDGPSDEDYAPETTSCGTGACVSTGVTSCVDGEVLDSCEANTPATNLDATCDGIDDNCNGSVDEGYVPTPTSCGYGECATTGQNACQNGHVVNTCKVLCEGHCADGSEDDGDGLVDCADPDCQNKPNTWPQCAQGRIGSPCGSNSDCVAGLTCDTSFPGGYCFRLPCGAGNTCPAGSFCWANTACVQPCVGAAGNQCPRPEHVCEPIPGMSVAPFCRPNCMQSCPDGTVCQPDTLQCM